MILNELKQRYTLLSKDNKNIYPIILIFTFINSIFNSFIGIMSLKVNNSFIELIYFFGINTVFSLLTVITLLIFSLKKRISINTFLKISLILYFLSYIYLGFSEESIKVYYIFAIPNGIGLSLFWMFVHHYEIKNSQKNKEIYMSFLSIGNQFITIFIPIYTFIIFYFSDHFLNNHNLLFLVTSFFMLISFFGLNNIQDIKTNKINVYSFIDAFKKEINNKNIRYYNLIHSSNTVNRFFVYSILTLFTLKELINISMFTFFVSIISLVFVSFVASKIERRNIKKIMLTSILFISLSFIIFLIFGINIYTYIVYSLFILIFFPNLVTIRRLVHLEIISNKKKSNSLNIIKREFILNIYRIINIIFYILLYFLISESYFIYVIMIIGLFLFSIEYLLTKKILNI